MSPDLQALLFNTVVPAVAAFFVAHFHILLPAPKKPVDPVVPPLVPSFPSIRPVGQGGILDLVGIFVTQILASSAPQEAKQAAITKLAEASSLVAAKA